MADSLLFDVVLVNNAGEVVLVGPTGLPMAEAIKHAGNANSVGSDGRCTAVVTMKGHYTVKHATDSLAEDCEEERTARQEALHARYRFIRGAFRRHLKRIRDASGWVMDSGDIGIVAASLHELARAIDDVRTHSCESFMDGLSGEWINTDLEEALGLTVEPAEAEAVG